jgi:septal ring factor EnvC (AmiA/AmiB activator)
MSAQLSAIDKQLATIGDSLASYSKGVDEFDKKVTKYDKDVSDLGAEIAAAKTSASDNDSLSEMLVGLRNRKGTKYGKQFTNLANQIDSIKDDYPEETLMRALKSGIDQISQFTVEDLKEIDAMGDGSRR